MSARREGLEREIAFRSLALFHYLRWLWAQTGTRKTCGKTSAGWAAAGGWCGTGREGRGWWGGGAPGSEQKKKKKRVRVFFYGKERATEGGRALVPGMEAAGHQHRGGGEAGWRVGVHRRRSPRTHHGEKIRAREQGEKNQKWEGERAGARRQSGDLLLFSLLPLLTPRYIPTPPHHGGRRPPGRQAAPLLLTHHPPAGIPPVGGGERGELGWKTGEAIARLQSGDGERAPFFFFSVAVGGTHRTSSRPPFDCLLGPVMGRP